MSNAENSAALRTRLGALKIDAASNVLGYAFDAWAKETKFEDPFPTPTAAAQMFGVIRKGDTIGAKSFQRLDPFVSMLAGVKDPGAKIEELARRNGHRPIHATQNGSEPEEEQELMVFHIDPKLRDLLQPIVERYEVAQAKVDEQQTILDEAKREASTLLNMLKAAGVVERQKYKREKDAPKKQQSRGSHISEARTLEILEAIRRYAADGHTPVLPDVPSSFTKPEIERALGINHSQVAVAVEKLREMGHVRQAGITQSGRNHQKTNVYALA